MRVVIREKRVCSFRMGPLNASDYRRRRRKARQSCGRIFFPTGSGRKTEGMEAK